MRVYRTSLMTFFGMFFCGLILFTLKTPAFAEFDYSRIPKELSQTCRGNFSTPDEVPALAELDSQKTHSEKEVWNLLEETYLSLLEEGIPQREARKFISCLILKTAELLPVSQAKRQKIRLMVYDAIKKDVPEEMALLSIDILDDVRKVYQTADQTAPERLEEQARIERVEKQADSEIQKEEKQSEQVSLQEKSNSPTAPAREEKLCSENLNKMNRGELSRLSVQVSSLEKRVASGRIPSSEIKRDIFHLRQSANRIFSSASPGCSPGVRNQAKGLVARLDRVPIPGVRGMGGLKSSQNMAFQQQQAAKDKTESSVKSFFGNIGKLFTGSKTDKKSAARKTSTNKQVQQSRPSATPTYVPEAPRQAPLIKARPKPSEYSSDIFDPAPRY